MQGGKKLAGLKKRENKFMKKQQKKECQHQWYGKKYCRECGELEIWGEITGNTAIDLENKLIAGDNSMPKKQQLCLHDIGHNSITHEGITHATGEQRCLTCHKTLSEIFQEVREETKLEMMRMKPLDLSKELDRLIFKVNQETKERISQEIRKETLEAVKAGTICLNCGNKKVKTLSDWCDKCFENE